MTSFFNSLKSINFVLLAGVAMCFLSLSCDRSPNTGGEIPQLQVDWMRTFKATDGVRTPPKTVGDSLVLFSGEAHLQALRTGDGSRKWKSKLSPETELYGRELIVEQGFIYSTHVGQILSWDLETGNSRWGFEPPEDKRIYELGFYNLGSDNLYASGSGKLYVIDREEGALVRVEEHAGASTLYRDGSLYIGQAWTREGAEGQSQGGILKVNAITQDSLWFYETARGGFYRMRPIVKGNTVYAGTRGGEKTEFVALDAATGEVIWRNTEARVYAAEMAAGKIFVNTGRDVMAIDKETGDTLWHAGLEAGHGESGLTYLEGYVYHPHGRGLRVIDAETGEVVHIEWPEHGYFWEVGVGAGKVFAQDSGALYAFEPYSPE